MKKRWFATIFVVGSCAAAACSSSNTDSNPSSHGGSSNSGSANGGGSHGGSANSGGANGGDANGGDANGGDANGEGANGGEAEAGASGSGGSTSEAGAAGRAEGGSDEAGAGGAQAGPTSFSLVFPTQSVAAGVENTICVVLDLGNDAAVHIGEVHSQLSAGGFELTVYKSSAAATSGPTSCTPLLAAQTAAGSVPLTLSRRPDDDLVLPSGVGFTLAPHQKIGLQLHYLSTAAQEISAQTTFTVESGSYQAEAGFIMLSDIDVTMPAGISEVVTGYLPGTPLAAASIFRFVGYTHQLGTEVTLATSASPGGTQSLIGDLDPAPAASLATGVATLSSAATVPTGGGFTLACHYGSNPNVAVSYGESANDEQCAALLWYSRAISASFCLHTDKSGGFDTCCPGGTDCPSN